MAHYLLADLYTSFPCRSPILQQRCQKYQTRAEHPDDICMEVSLGHIHAFQAKYPQISRSEAELVILSSRFSAQLLDHNGLVLHASAIADQGRAVLFSAPSGVGKSTHTRLWQQQFGPDAVVILNDDQPALRLLDHQWWVYGTPFSGNSDENLNCRCPLHAIVFLERSPYNSIRPLSVEEALPYCVRNSPYRRRPAYLPKFMDVLHQLLPETSLYLLSCNMEAEAARLARKTLFP